MDLDLAMRFNPTGLLSSEPRRTTPDVKASLTKLLETLVQGKAVLLPPPPGTKVPPGTPRILKRKELDGIPALSFLNALLPRGTRLVVALWADQTAAIAVAPTHAGDPPDSWLASAYEAAQQKAGEVLLDLSRHARKRPGNHA